MKNLITSILQHRDLYLISISMGTILSSIISILADFNSLLIFGINVVLWLVVLIINIVDIHTGIKADTKRRSDVNLKFQFESRKGWRAFEKVFVFTMIVWFIYTLELEAIRLEFFGFIPSLLLGIKFTLLIYVMLIEIQSIGENEEVRFGKKSKLFRLLDSIIETINEGLLKRLKRFIEE